MSAFSLFTTVGCITAQAAAGLYTADLIPLVIAGIAGALPVQRVGVFLGRRIGQKAFHRMLLAFLVCATASLAYRGITDWQ